MGRGRHGFNVIELHAPASLSPRPVAMPPKDIKAQAEGEVSLGIQCDPGSIGT